MELKPMHLFGMAIGTIIVIISFVFFDQKNLFFLLAGLGIITGIFPFVFGAINDSRIANEKEDMFLEFSRNLVESVKAGTPISKSIINIKDKPYGVLSENIKKLANQISMGIPLNTALQIFSNDANNKTISRALTLIGQAEKAGGDIGKILEAVADAVSMSDKLKKERKAAISTLVVQGYIIFVIFLVIVLIMQFKILPMITGIANIGTSGISVAGIPATGGAVDQNEISASFLYLLLVQGLFSGLIIGKLAEGNVKAGIKHSFALMLMSFLVSTISGLFFAAPAAGV